MIKCYCRSCNMDIENLVKEYTDVDADDIEMQDMIIAKCFHCNEGKYIVTDLSIVFPKKRLLLKM